MLISHANNFLVSVNVLIFWSYQISRNTQLYLSLSSSFCICIIKMWNCLIDDFIRQIYIIHWRVKLPFQYHKPQIAVLFLLSCQNYMNPLWSNRWSPGVGVKNERLSFSGVVFIIYQNLVVVTWCTSTKILKWF